MFKYKCFMLRKKSQNLGLKMPYLDILGNKLKTIYAIFANSALKVERFMQNVRNFNL